MDTVGSILFGAAFTGLSALSLGLLLVQALRLPLHRTEARLIGFLLGSAVLSLAVFLSAAGWLVRPWWFAVVGGSALAASVWRGAWRYGCDIPREALSRAWRAVVVVCILAFGVFSFMHAMAPEISADGATYHLGTVSRYLRQGGFGIYTTNMYANLPMGVEMLFLFAFAFGKHSAAALVHWQFYVLLPLLLISAGKRFGFVNAGAVAALLVFCSPVAGVDGASAYVDVATAAVAFALFYLLLVWERERTHGLLVAAGLLAGFAYTCKMTAWPAVPFSMAYVAWFSWRKREPWLRGTVAVAAFAAVLVSPWLVKNAIVIGNPVSPFLNRLFPNPHVHIAFEEEYRVSLRDYYGSIKSVAQIPLEVTVRGGVLNGLLGPIFLLAPIGLLALRWPLGRRALIGAVVFLLSYPSNIGTRFLLPAVPFIALAMAMVLTNWRGMAALAVVFHAFFSWPTILPLFADEYAWRLDEFRYKAAIRSEKPDDFMVRWFPPYRMARLIEEKVPPDGKVLTYSGVPEAYTSREILVVYQSGLNNTLGDILVTGIAVTAQPLRLWDFRFNSRPVRRLRIVQTKSTPDLWSVTELRVFAGDVEIRRDERWRVRAEPNPWEAQLAFDNSPATRWRSHEAARPGMYMEVDFGRAIEIDRMRAEVSPDQAASARVEMEVAPGKWETIDSEPDVSSRDAIPNARRIATRHLKQRGVTHLVFNDDDFIANEMYLNSERWGVTFVGRSESAKLYRID
jgi:4-amino-4-deoxy-L-arabinose transferase-like glycosyltransferase